MISPGPCLLPARTRFGGLSTIDMNSGLSAGWAFARRLLCDIYLHWGQILTAALLLTPFTMLDVEVSVKLRACRTKAAETFIFAWKY